ncbi:MAG: thiamine phosphate synthase [Elusimicrobiota bacterium]
MQNFELYAITSPVRGVGYPEMVGEAFAGGVDIVQFRAKDLSDREFFEIAQQLVIVAREWKRPLIINDRIDIALAVNADGVHLGQDDLPLSAARMLAARKKGFLIGKSTHNLEQALQAEKDGADYIGVGPVFATPTKPDYPPVGLELVKQVKDKVRIPFAAIGGIDETNLAQVIECGAEAIAVVRAVFGQKNIREAAKELKEKIKLSSCAGFLNSPLWKRGVRGV